MLLELVQLGFREISPVVGLLKQLARHFSQSSDPIFNVTQILFKYCLANVLLNLKRSFQFVKAFLKVLFELSAFGDKGSLQFVNLLLIYSVFCGLLYYLVYRYQQFCSCSYLSYDFLFHPNVMIFMITKKSAVAANTLAVLDAHDF